MSIVWEGREMNGTEWTMMLDEMEAGAESEKGLGGVGLDEE
jgi:hypothetical protein